MACCVLQNIARDRKQPEFEDGDLFDDGVNGMAVDEDDRGPRNQPNWRSNRPETTAQEKLRLRRMGFFKRDTIAFNDFRR